MQNIINQTAEALLSGGVILYPTDTIWGLGSLASNEAATKKVFDIKQRAHSQKLILLVNSVEMLERYIPKISPKAIKLVQHYYKPLTIVYENPVNLPKSLISEDNTIAIRAVKDAFCHKLIDCLDEPITSTSANISGQPIPLNFNEIPNNIVSSVDFAVPHRQNELLDNTASKIVRFNASNELEVIRE